MEETYQFSRHARERSDQRGIPPLVVEAIISYGLPHDAGEGVQRYALSKDGMRQLRRFTGRQIANVIDGYRRRNAYVVVARGTVITVAFANKPIFH